MKNLILFIIWTNRIILSVTVILYFTVILGLCAQVILGNFQVLSFLILLCSYKSYNEIQKKYLLIYFVFVTLYFVLGYLFRVLNLSFNSSIYYIFGLVVIPLSLAGLFTYILENIKKNYE